jgi:hypothetical protein
MSFASFVPDCEPIPRFIGTGPRFERLPKLGDMLIKRMSKRLAADRARFVEPCLASPADKHPSGTDWIHEIKMTATAGVARDPIGILPIRVRATTGRSAVR